jgi:hypothetical protein
VVCYNRQGDAQQLRLFPEAEDVPLPGDPAIVQVRLQQVGWTNPRGFGDVWLAWIFYGSLIVTPLDMVAHTGGNLPLSRFEMQLRRSRKSFPTTS